MSSRVVLLLTIFSTLLIVLLWGWLEMQSSGDSLRFTSEAAVECERLVKQIEELKAKQVKSIESDVQQDLLLGRFSKGIQEVGLPATCIGNVLVKPSEKLSKSQYSRNDIELQLRAISQRELLAFLKGISSDELPLNASQIQFDAIEARLDAQNGLDEERWDVKLLLTYFVRSAKS